MVTSALYDSTGGHPALDFLNSMDRSAGRPWVERLVDPAAYYDWCRLAGVLEAGPARALARRARAEPAAAARALARARALREALYRVFLGAAGEPAPVTPADLELVNSELARALGKARLVRTARGFAWGWAAQEDLELPLWKLARAAAELLTSDELTLVKRCASTTCLWLFLDRTKNHARRWCDMKVCGNRDKVQRHRDRARHRQRSRA